MALERIFFLADKVKRPFSFSTILSVVMAQTHDGPGLWGTNGGKQAQHMDMAVHNLMALNPGHWTETDTTKSIETETE